MAPKLEDKELVFIDINDKTINIFWIYWAEEKLQKKRIQSNRIKVPISWYLLNRTQSESLQP